MGFLDFHGFDHAHFLRTGEVPSRDRRYYRYRIDIVRLGGLSLSIGIEIAHLWVSVSISISTFLNPWSQSQYQYRICTSLGLSHSLSIENCTSLSLSLSLFCIEKIDTFWFWKWFICGGSLGSSWQKGQILIVAFLTTLHPALTGFSFKIKVDWS